MNKINLNYVALEYSLTSSNSASQKNLSPFIIAMPWRFFLLVHCPNGDFRKMGIQPCHHLSLFKGSARHQSSEFFLIRCSMTSSALRVSSSSSKLTWLHIWFSVSRSRDWPPCRVQVSCVTTCEHVTVYWRSSRGTSQGSPSHFMANCGP